MYSIGLLSGADGGWDDGDLQDRFFLTASFIPNTKWLAVITKVCRSISCVECF